MRAACKRWQCIWATHHNVWCKIACGLCETYRMQPQKWTDSRCCCRHSCKCWHRKMRTLSLVRLAFSPIWRATINAISKRYAKSAASTPSSPPSWMPAIVRRSPSRPSVHCVIWHRVIRTPNWHRIRCVWWTSVCRWLSNCWIHRRVGPWSKRSSDSFAIWHCARRTMLRCANTAPSTVSFVCWSRRSRTLAV